MTAEEAKKIFHSNNVCWDLELKANVVIDTALEKQIPIDGELSSQEICGRKTVFCNCGHMTSASNKDDDIKIIYCYYCGQAIKVEENDDGARTNKDL